MSTGRRGRSNFTVQRFEPVPTSQFSFERLLKDDERNKIGATPRNPKNLTPREEEIILENNQADQFLIPNEMIEQRQCGERAKKPGICFSAGDYYPQWLDRPLRSIQLTEEQEELIKTRPVPLSFQFTYTRLLYVLNLVAFLLHAAGAISVYAIAKSAVTIELWTPKAVFPRPELDALVAGNTTVVFDFVPTYFLSESPPVLSLRDLTAAFFLLSAAAHLFVVLTGPFYWIYFQWVHDCRQPLRWVEYVFSSSCMIVLIAVFAGARDASLVLTLVGLNATTMLFGWVTEALSRPQERETKSPEEYFFVYPGTGLQSKVERKQYSCLHDQPYEKWEICADNSDLLVCNVCPSSKAGRAVMAALQRMFPLLLGCIPYAIAWSIIFGIYAESTREARDEGIFPSFVDAVVWAEFFLFSSFAVVAFAQQISERGPSYYYWTEVAYLVLSLVSKLTLGIVLLSNVFVVESFGDIFDVDAYVRSELAKMGAENATVAS